jgi:DNA polymerase type B, organellar and viral
MSFEPITSKLRERRIVTYDLEWYPETMQFRLGGMFDGAHYRYATSIGDFCRMLFTRENENAWLYAHAGGVADVVFLLEEIFKYPSVRAEAAFSGSSAVHVLVSVGKHRWTLLDSYWLLKDKLAHLGHSLGLQKTRGDYHCSHYPACGHVGSVCPSAPKCGCSTDPEPKCMFYAPLAELASYNEQDCRILHAGIDRFQEELLAMGSDLQVTIASTAMRLFRRKYLKSTIPTSTAVSDRVRAAYVASRVEPIRTRCDTPLHEYDINSSFPFAATKTTPGGLIGLRRSLPKSDRALYFAHAKISVPDMFLPPLGRRAKRDGRIYFPTGTWEGLFSKPNIELLEEAGGRVEKLFEVMVFDARDDFAGYMIDLFEKRRKATDPFTKMLIKYLLNSPYGKTAESREKTRLLLHPYSDLCPHGGEHDVVEGGVLRATCVEVLFEGAILVTEEKEIPHEHVPIAAQITSEAGCTLWHGAKPCGTDLFYMDTDSLYTHATLPTGDALGQWKHERVVPPPSHFAAPKLYRTGDKVKSKGFSHLTVDQYEDLLVGREVAIDRMLRIREAARSKEHIGPVLAHLTKKLALDKHRPKRKMDRDPLGASVPWDVSQTEERYHANYEE